MGTPDVYTEQLEELLGGSLFSLLLSELPSSLISLATYVLTALALYQIAKRRGINRPWLAWIPVVNVYMLGCIADQYRQVAKGEAKSRRKVLLGINIAQYVLLIAMLVLVVIMLVGLLGFGLDALEDEMYVYAHEEELLSAVLGPAVGILLLCFPALVLAIIYMVFYYIALHDIYKSCEPGNATLYLVLSIFISITQPIFLFICREKDGGMPPRTPQNPPAYEPVYEMPQQPVPPAEPWEQNNL